MEKMEIFSVKMCWGNFAFDYVHSDSVGNSGGILCVWDPSSYRKKDVTVSDYFIMIRGVWLKTGCEVIIMGDFNEVRCKSERFGSNFNVQGANVFNSFIVNAGLEEIPLGGCSFTWCHKSATKMSKLDRFLISENLMITCPNFTATSLERYLSDHRPILLRESHFDYGPTPFRFFHSWFEMEGFNKLVEDAWNEAPVDESNAMSNMMKKLKYLKQKIRDWNKGNMKSSKNIKAKLKDDLKAVDDIIDNGEGNDEVELELEVSKDEVKRAVWDCGTDKAPGPDGFTFGFYRRFWKVIENDVFDAVNHFFTYGDIPKGCNSSFIALIPKIPDANVVKDFRPISLIGSLYKIIAKILANRLVVVLGDIVNEVQSAFIADRQILDGPFILNEVLQWCKSKKKQSLIFKVDFEKAYDSVRWDFLDEVLKKFGFGDKWCTWIQSCLRSSRGSIIINGSPTAEFQFHKGLKQGDPLSPFLFILIMESLHLSFQRVVDARMFKGITLSSSLMLSHMFYADDVIFVGQWCDDNINTLVQVLECFFHASGLHINMNKSKLMGVLVDDEKVKQAASKLGCLILKPPFSYLGSKVGGSMHRIQAWNEVVDRVYARLSKWKMKTLSIGGRLTLLKSVLGSMPIYHMSIFRVPMSVLRRLESIRSHFFNGHDPNSKRTSWVKWKNVLASKEKGGLGVSSLYALNRGLMFKWVWRFFTQNTSLWSRVIKAIHGEDGKVGKQVKSAFPSYWMDIVHEINVLKNQGINLLNCMQMKLGNGDKTAFWEDIWIGHIVLKDLYPRIYALETCKFVKVGTKLTQSSLDFSFRRKPRGGIEQEQYEALLVQVQDVNLVPVSDRWKWSLENSGDFSVASVRKMLDDKMLPDVTTKTRWIKLVPIKVNVHAWKVKIDSLPTRFNISRRGMDIESITCSICDNEVESSSHLFFKCNMVRDIIRKITRWWDITYIEADSYEDWLNWLVNLRLSSNYKQALEGVFYVMWWHVWQYRNKYIFEAVSSPKAMIFEDIVSRSFYWCHNRCKASFSWNDWLKNPYLVAL
ncbi:RNA-directed DNA polymerase, eukaryota, reverse transcriptase zinc-binding domain protein [Tanacetum coccineum]